MNRPKFSDQDYIDFLIASPRAFSCTQAARVQTGGDNFPPALDAITRLVYRLQANLDELWQDARWSARWSTFQLPAGQGVAAAQERGNTDAMLAVHLSGD
jgi:hypothetical protein